MRGSLMVATEPLAARRRCFLPSLIAAATTAAAGSRWGVVSRPASCLVAIMVISTVYFGTLFGIFVFWAFSIKGSLFKWLVIFQSF